MSKFRMIIISALTAVCIFGLSASVSSSAQTKPTFTSLYTDLKKECKEAFKSVNEGSDMPLLCKGYGGYKIYIYFSAAASQIDVIRPIRSELVHDPISLTMQELNYDQQGRKVEWRMANGKPFAVILRISNYKEGEGGDPFAPQNKTGELLIVKGLKGYEHIDFTVDAKTPNANEKAREMADSNFNKK